MDLFEKCLQPSKASLMKQAGVYPYFRAIGNHQDIEVMMEGKRRIMLGSNNYLGLTSNPEIVEAGIHAIEQYGTGSSSSRFLNGTFELHLELEEELARFHHKDAALTFSAGFLANLSIISALVGANDYVISDKENHASIYDGSRLSYGTMLRYEHGDINDLEIQLQKVPKKCGCLIATDGVFSMSGEIAKLPEICALAKKYGARVMVDDAHGLGVLGIGGRGTASHFGLEDQVDIYMSTFSKSLASLGGYMAASAEVIEYVKHDARPFVFSTAMPPSNCAVSLAALRYLKNHPELVQNLLGVSSYMRECLRRKDVQIIKSATPIIPIYTYDTMNTLTKAFVAYEQGVYVNPVLPPACVEGEGLLRVCCMATLTKPIVDEATDILADVLLN